MNWYLKVLQEYANFEGRARRQEYWMFALFQIIAFIIAMIIDSFAGLSFGSEVPYGWIYMLYALATFIPSLAVGIRRLHDSGKSGWWYLIAFVPFIGGLWLLVLLCMDSEFGQNKWGPNPKGEGNSAAIDPNWY